MYWDWPAPCCPRPHSALECSSLHHFGLRSGRVEEDTCAVEDVDRDSAVAALKNRVDIDGMMVVDQDIYHRSPIGGDFADIVLPAAGWGECDLSRCNGERRLRLYSKFSDPPGEAQPDWWIISKFAQKMGFKDYDWKDSNDVFEKAARSGRKG